MLTFFSTRARVQSTRDPPLREAAADSYRVISPREVGPRPEQLPFSVTSVMNDGRCGLTLFGENSNLSDGLRQVPLRQLRVGDGFPTLGTPSKCLMSRVPFVAVRT